MTSKQYTVVDNGNFVDFIGVAGTLAEGLTSSVQKLSIVRLSSKDSSGTISFRLANDEVISFNYEQLIDPGTGDPFEDLESAMLFIKAVISHGDAVLWVSSEDIRTIVRLTQAEYDALDPKDPNTLYIIVE
jgi:hypothetical protein